MSKLIVKTAIERSKDALVRTARAVPADKLNWRPLENGRSVLDLVGDSAQTTLSVVGILTGDGYPDPQRVAQQAEERAGWTLDEAIEQLEKNTAALLAVIDEFPTEKLEEPHSLPINGGLTMPWGIWMLSAYRNTMSRAAQINYIQTLYGDYDRH